MRTVPRSERLQIVIFGLRNAGKSSLLNALADRPIAIVSSKPGTTTDPVSKAMELGALGPVVITDTAGLDDEGDLGALRVEKSLERLSWADVGVFVTALDRVPEQAEMEAYAALANKGKPLIIAATFADRDPRSDKEAWLALLEDSGHAPAAIIRTSGITGQGIPELSAALMRIRDCNVTGLGETAPLEGLVSPGDIVILVTPIDSAAPKGRLILPQVEVLRDALDRGCQALVVRETELAEAYANLKRRPRLVVTDSQAFVRVAADLPLDQPLTSFSILFARKKGELSAFHEGLEFLDRSATSMDAPEQKPLRLLILESCTHQRTHEDIGSVKIPALLGKRTGRTVERSLARELPASEELGSYDIAITCGGCMITRGKMIMQLDALRTAGLPVVNYGLFLAWANGLMPRVIEPFVIAR